MVEVAISTNFKRLYGITRVVNEMTAIFETNKVCVEVSDFKVIYPEASMNKGDSAHTASQAKPRFHYISGM